MKNLLILMTFMAIAGNAFAQTYLSRQIRLPFGVAASGPLLPDINSSSISPSVVNVDTTEQTLWSEGGDYPWLSVATTLSVASADANDSSAGTGLRALVIECLDANYDTFFETVTMNGQTPVAMTQDCLRVQGNGMTALSAGSGGFNAGKIYVGHGVFTAGVPADILGTIEIGTNRSNFGILTVPRHFSFMSTQFVFSNADNALTELFIRVRRPGEPFIKGVGFNVSSNTVSLSSFVPQRVSGMTDIEMRGKSAVSNADIKLLISYIMGRNI